MHRRRATASSAEELALYSRLSNDKDISIRGEQQSCPGPVKMPRNHSGNKKPTPLCFNNNVMLSPIYNPNLSVSYFEQVFKHLGIMGQGSFGTVIRVRSREDTKLYAVKQLKAHIGSIDRCAEVKNNELIGSNENCVRYFMSWEENYDTFILLEYCEISLQDFSKINRNLPEDLLWNVLYDMCHALSFLHKMTYIHLDVKPGNIMMRKGHFKLGDFGLLVDVKMEKRARVSTLSDGDAKYLAHEVLSGIYTTSCDVFGLGISIFELSTDIQLPEQGGLWHQLRHEVLPSWFYERVSYRLSTIIEKMVVSDYKLRPSAEKILTYGTLKEISKRDTKIPRIDYAAPFVQPDDFYDPVPLGPMDYADSILTTTPPSSNEIRHSLMDYGYGSYYNRRESDVENKTHFSGRKSLFCNSGPGMEEELAQCLFDSGIGTASADNSQASADITDNSFAKGSVMTSTPVIPKAKDSMLIPRTRLTFD
ncbi:unnamed protein product [Ceutorhynchus assimilis]|uniref:non-specific serine/threonine protein kinase n=1 Tax=Ceutorhynchus assimilis TaxID=467358 RepID=A0A9P0GR68_9CUCU|nr:unnamed protein product [Ceutorhynchus assimilis]